MDRPLSHSQMNMFLKCPAQYYFRYIEGRKVAPPGPLVFGSALEQGTNANYEQKIKTERDLSVTEVTDHFVDYFDTRADDTDWQGEDPGELRECGQGLLVQHMKDWAPLIMPETCQEDLTIEVSGMAIRMILDVTTRNSEIIEIKTSSKSPSKDGDGKHKLSYEHLTQLLLYTWGYKADRGRDPLEVTALYHVKLKKQPKIVAASAITTPQQERFILDQCRRAKQSIALCKTNDLWMPNRGHNMCSPKHCGFWGACHELYGPNEEVEKWQE